MTDDHKFDHSWHVAINQHHDELRKQGTDWQRWMYEAKTAHREVMRLATLFKREREGTLRKVHRQCSMSEIEPVKDNHLSCCLGVECRKCPHLLALEKMPDCTPEQIDEAKAWTCTAHIISEGGDLHGEGYVLTVDDRMFWDRVHSSMAGVDTDTP